MQGTAGESPWWSVERHLARRPFLEARGAIKRAVRDWFEAQPDLDPQRLVFIDETGLSTKMARLRGRAPRGERCRAGIPRRHWNFLADIGRRPPSQEPCASAA